MSDGSAEDLVEVTLRGLPLPMYRRASEHHDELRREFALINTTNPDVGSVPARLQALIDDLEARFGAFTAQTTAAMRQALARGEEVIDLTYRVPPRAAEAVLELSALLDDADAFCQSGEHLLTLATPADCLAYRRWFLGEFAAQIGGAAPTPWAASAAQEPTAD